MRNEIHKVSHGTAGSVTTTNDKGDGLSNDFIFVEVGTCIEILCVEEKTQRVFTRFAPTLALEIRFTAD